MKARDSSKVESIKLKPSLPSLLLCRYQHNRVKFKVSSYDVQTVIQVRYYLTGNKSQRANVLSVIMAIFPVMHAARLDSVQTMWRRGGVHSKRRETRGDAFKLSASTWKSTLAASLAEIYVSVCVCVCSFSVLVL